MIEAHSSTDPFCKALRQDGATGRDLAQGVDASVGHEQVAIAVNRDAEGAVEGLASLPSSKPPSVLCPARSARTPHMVIVKRAICVHTKRMPLEATAVLQTMAPSELKSSVVTSASRPAYALFVA